MTPSTPKAGKTLAERAKLAYQGLMAVLDSYSSKGYIDTGAHDVFVSIVREMGEIATALKAASSESALAELRKQVAAMEDEAYPISLKTKDGLRWVSLISVLGFIDLQLDKLNAKEEHQR